MNKLIWVLLPLLLGAGVLAGLALRGRWPTRLALNVVSSLLLLVYVMTTAGLGIFWVANQHLPVFDWHYLFGYATVLLLALHLTFNFRVVWRWLVQRRVAPVRRPVQGPQEPDALTTGPPQRPAATAAQALQRRPLLGGALGLLGLAAATGAAYWLGLRQGRTVLLVGAGSSGGAATAASGGDTIAVAGGARTAGAAVTDTAWAIVERFHEFSAHSRAGVFRRAPSHGWGAPQPPFKSYPDAARLSLPAPRAERTLLPPTASPPGLQALSLLLWHCAGVNEVRGGITFRTSPSSGALFSTELYLAVDGIAGVNAGVDAGAEAGIAAGLWHYAAHSHALHRLTASGADTPHGSQYTKPAAFGLAEDATAPVRLVATAVFGRSGQKYGDRAYRYVLADLGHSLENLFAAAAALGWQARLEPAFDEARIVQMLALDEAVEGVLALVSIWPTRAATPAAGPGPVVAAVKPAAPGPAPAAPDAGWQTPRLAGRSGSQLTVTDAIHQATSLRMPLAAPVTGPGQAAAATAGPLGPVQVAAFDLPAPQAAPAAPLDVIARRRSVRRFASTPLALADLSAVLDAMLRRHRPRLSSAVRLDLVVHAVQGLAPGCWRYDPVRHRLLPRRLNAVLREESRRAALDQDVIGDAAAVFVLAIRRADLAADPAGPARGYRHAFVEAGMVGERLYLEAGARDLGVCAVGAFYDDEAVRLVAGDMTQEWVVHFAALGRPQSP